LCNYKNRNSKIRDTIKGRIFLSITRVRAGVEKKNKKDWSVIDVFVFIFVFFLSSVRGARRRGQPTNKARDVNLVHVEGIVSLRLLAVGLETSRVIMPKKETN
jgi:hypothetical protein